MGSVGARHADCGVGQACWVLPHPLTSGQETVVALVTAARSLSIWFWCHTTRKFNSVVAVGFVPRGTGAKERCLTSKRGKTVATDFTITNVNLRWMHQSNSSFEVDRYRGPGNVARRTRFRERWDHGLCRDWVRLGRMEHGLRLGFLISDGLRSAWSSS